jgi:gamma-glutamyltranspeptidase
VAALAQRGGVMAPEDLAAHRSHPTRPIHSTFRGHTVYESPSPCAPSPARPARTAPCP